MKPSPLEKLEKLEQLRALENGHRIIVTPVNYEPLSVDTPDDLQKVITFFSHSQKKT
jgi:3-deoxy-manno-octulosonate cytidylyltransferase (CMP-KDO synthetase)